MTITKGVIVYLKRLEMYGFKSFGTKSVLDFEHDGQKSNISAIVGPNGSGKSNVADAVRWVLGEQSSKLLRSKKSEDVIFCGSQSKSRSSYAEISLTLAGNQSVEVEINNKKHQFNEIEISRKLYRSGESEYLINKKKVRLLDVQQLLASLGFGQSSYTVIGQGMVDRLLFFNAAERKVLFDEAAGVKQYEIKREQAIRKLESTDANLIRLKDILTELEPRVVNLRRLVKRAESRKEVEIELHEIQNRYYSCLEFELKNNIGKFSEDKNDLNNKIVQIEREIDSITQKLDKEESKSDLNESIQKAEQKLNEITRSRDSLMQKVAQIEAQANQKEQQVIESKREKERLETEIKSLNEKLTFLTKKIDEEKQVLKNEDSNKQQLVKELEIIEKEKESFSRKLEEVEKTNEKAEIKSIKEKLAQLELKKRELITEIYTFEQKISIERSEKEKREAKRIAFDENLKNFEKELSFIEAEILQKESDSKKYLSELNQTKEDVLKNVKEIEKIEKDISDISNVIKKEELKVFELEIEQTFKDLNILSKEEVSTLFKDKFVSLLKRVEGVFNRAKKISKSLDEDGRAQLEGELRKIRENQKILEAKVYNLSLEFEKTNAAIENLREKKLSVIERIENLKTEIIEISNENPVSQNNSVENAKNELQKIEDEIVSLEKNFQEINKGFTEKRESILSQKESLHEKETQIRQQIFDLELKLNRQSNTIENQERELESTKSRIAWLKRKQDEILVLNISSVGDKSDELEQEKNKLENVNLELSKARAEMTEIMARQRDFGQKTIELERKRRFFENDAMSLKNKLNQIELEEAKYSTRLEDLYEELRISEMTLKKCENLEILDQQGKDVLRAKIENLRRRLEVIGGVDPETVAEYEELESRSTQMSTQISDLEKAKNDLEKVIKELDLKIKKQFSDVFSNIATEFNRFFQILFNGGKAELSLGEDEEGNFGIEISANPPGKKVQSLNALSGGERTLTSLALVFAILSINPSPFCVLDEVDAALDESNTLRFAKILKDLDKKTQFIVISHNRETMRAADSLYGITMDSDHVSKMISIRLTEALEAVRN